VDHKPGQLQLAQKPYQRADHFKGGGSHNGTLVAQVQDNNRIVLKPVTLGRNLGNEVEVRSGISTAERLIDNPQEFLTPGDFVRVVGQAAPPHTASAE